MITLKKSVKPTLLRLHHLTLRNFGILSQDTNAGFRGDFLLPNLMFSSFQFCAFLFWPVKTANVAHQTQTITDHQKQSKQHVSTLITWHRTLDVILNVEPPSFSCCASIVGLTVSPELLQGFNLTFFKRPLQKGCFFTQLVVLHPAQVCYLDVLASFGPQFKLQIHLR